VFGCWQADAIRTGGGRRRSGSLYLAYDAGASWPYAGERELAPVVAICGDDQLALDQTRSLIADLGAEPAEIGGLASARQLEDAAGFVMRVLSAGANPSRAVPDVDPAALSQLQPAEA
jgi:hypothetical protein